MNRRNFALSWGRKLFFGLSWPLTLLLSLVYLKSFILPQNFIEGLYFVTSLIGQTGILTAIVYFVLYVPLVIIFPNYYMARIWALLLILILNFLILLDALSFSGFHLHLYSYIWKPILETGLQSIIPVPFAATALLMAAFVLSLIIWFRGEFLWRIMQGRFSNPVSNWYLVLIGAFLIIGRFALHDHVSSSLAAVFPLNIESIRPIEASNDSRNVHYPSSTIQCAGKHNPNIVMIVLGDWDREEFTPEFMPLTFLMKRHGLNFNSHYKVATTREEGLFCLMYSIPSSYKGRIKNIAPALYTELNKRKYETLVLGATNETETMPKFREWIANRTGDLTRPTFLSLSLGRASKETDALVQEIILTIQKDGLLKGAQVIITSATSTGKKLPLLWINSDRVSAEINHPTSVYDVIPSLMQKIWSCKNSFRFASTGENLDRPERDWVLVSSRNHFEILDLKNNGIISVQDRFIQEKGNGELKLLFPALKKMTEFYRIK